MHRCIFFIIFFFCRGVLSPDVAAAGKRLVKKRTTFEEYNKDTLGVYARIYIHITVIIYTAY